MGSDAGRPFRFGAVLTGAEPATWAGRCQRVEALGYDVLLAPDHLWRAAPFSSLGAAAAVTERVRLGTFVLNTAFYDPGLLAREVATLDGLSGGRFELGLGSGYVRSEFDTLGLPYGAPSDRLDRLEHFLRRLEDCLADPDLRPRPVQQPVPVFLGGNGNRMLRIAAQHAQIVGFSGTTVDADGRLSLIGGDDFADRVRHARAAAGARADDVEWNALVQVVEITDDRQGAAERLRDSWAPHLGIEEFLAAPTVLVGTVEEMAADLEERRQRLGLTYISVLEPAMEDFAVIIDRLRRHGPGAADTSGSGRDSPAREAVRAETGIRLLGDVAVLDHGEVRRQRGRRQRTLLALLALHAGEAVDADLLIEEVWDEELPSNHRAMLHITITRLRVWLGDVARLSGSGGRYTLDIDPRRVDLLAFLAAAEVALQGNDPTRHDEAIALWRDPVLPEVESRRIAAARAHAEERRRALGSR